MNKQDGSGYSLGLNSVVRKVVYNQGMNISTPKTTREIRVSPAIRRYPSTRVSRGGLDEINPDDIIYGEYASGGEGAWIDLVYRDDDVLRTFSGAVSLQHPVVEELKLLLRDEKGFYVVPVKEVPVGFAFKHVDIVDIKVGSTINGNEEHAPSCVWTIHFRGGNMRTLEAEYQAYFAYGNTARPASMTNASILDKVFTDGRKG